MVDMSVSRTTNVLHTSFFFFLIGSTQGSFIPRYVSDDVCRARGDDCMAPITLPSFLFADSLDENGDLIFTCNATLKAQVRTCLAGIGDCNTKSFQTLLSMSDDVCNNSEVFVSGADCWMEVFYGTELSFCGFCHHDCYREHATDLSVCTKEHAELLYRVMVSIAEGDSCLK